MISAIAQLIYSILLPLMMFQQYQTDFISTATVPHLIFILSPSLNEIREVRDLFLIVHCYKGDGSAALYIIKIFITHIYLSAFFSKERHIVELTLSVLNT